MNTLENHNCSGGTIQEMQNIIATQNEKLCEYENKLVNYKEVVIERDNLLESIKQFKEWRRKNEFERTNIFTEQLTSFEAQSEQIQKATTEKCNLQSKYCDLQKVNDNITDQLKTLKLNENMFQLKLENSEENTKWAQKELCHIKVKLEEANCIVRKLKTNIKSNEEEICTNSKTIEEFTKTYNCLNNTIMSLEADLKRTKAKLDDVKLSAKCAQENCRLDLDTLSDQLKMKSKQLDDLEIRYNEANSQLNENQCKIKTLMTTLRALIKTSLSKFNEIKNVTQKLKEENCAKQAKLLRLKKQ